MLPLWDTAPHRRQAVVTAFLIAANLGVFVYQITLAIDGGQGLEAFIREYALVPKNLVAGYTDGRQWLTVLTSMFLHGGVAHVLGNCWFLWVFGRNVEERLGSALFLFFYLCSGLGAAAAQVAVHPQAALPMIGASGAISGVMGAYFLLQPTAWVYALVPWIVPIVPLPAFLFLFVWFAVQAMEGVGSLLNGTADQGGVAWWAHAGGFVAGMIMILVAKSAGWVKRK